MSERMSSKYLHQAIAIAAGRLVDPMVVSSNSKIDGLKQHAMYFC
jgi:hypothetical protein